MYEQELSTVISIYLFFYFPRYEVIIFGRYLGNLKWAVGYTQSNFLSYIVISFVIGIDEDID